MIQHFTNQYGWVPADNRFRTLCYRVEEVDYNLPIITLHLDGADFVAHSSGLFQVFDGFFCMNFLPSETTSIWGSTLMFNHKFIFDLDGGFLLFVEETCPVDVGE